MKEQLVECTDNSNACQQKGSYYCTVENGIWKWRECATSCSGGICGAPNIETSSTLTINIGC